MDSNTPDELTLLRNELDLLDSVLIEKLARRLAVIENVDKIKLKNGVARYDAKRWNAASAKREALAKEYGISADLVTKIFDTIHSYVLDNVYKMPRAYYLGPQGSFSYQAAEKLVDLGQYRLEPCRNWLDLWQNLHENENSIAVVPIENSITSNVHANVDVLFEGDFKIIEEGYLQINLGLFAKKGVRLTEISEVYSHPQALAQAKKLLQNKNWLAHEASSTTAALSQVIKSSSKAIAALAPLNTSRRELACLMENAQDTSENQTRFIVVTASSDHLFAGTKASVIAEVAHEVGSLEKLLKDFSDKNIDLSKIESRPIPGKTWSYRFWIDLTLPEATSGATLNSLLQGFTTLETFTLLGLYEPGKVI